MIRWSTWGWSEADSRRTSDLRTSRRLCEEAPLSRLLILGIGKYIESDVQKPNYSTPWGNEQSELHPVAGIASGEEDSDEEEGNKEEHHEEHLEQDARLEATDY